MGDLADDVIEKLFERSVLLFVNQACQRDLVGEISSRDN